MQGDFEFQINGMPHRVAGVAAGLPLIEFLRDNLLTSVKDSCVTVGCGACSVLLSVVPFSYPGRNKPQERAKVDFDVLHNARLRVRQLAENAGIDTEVGTDGYPNFDYLIGPDGRENWQTLLIRGKKAGAFLSVVLTGDIGVLKPGDEASTLVLAPDGQEIAGGLVERKDYEIVR